MIIYSIIIPLYNQLDELHWHNKFYSSLWEVRQDFEVLYMDDGSADGTKQFFKETKIPYNYQYDYVDDAGFRVAYAKNRGIRMAKGKWCLIIDGDTFIDQDTLKEYDTWANDPMKCYFGKRFPIDFDKLSSHVNNASQYLNGGLKETALKKEDFRGFLHNIPPAPHNHFSGANFLCDTKEIKKTGYAWDKFVGYGYDDYVFAIQWLTSGHTFDALNDCIAYHAKDAPKPGSERTKKLYMDFIEKHKEQLGKL